jgi:hypothetical protein
LSIQAKQQSISELITIVVDKALIFYTQLTDAQVTTAPLVKNMETMDLTAPKVTTTDANEVVQITQELNGNLNESDS